MGLEINKLLVPMKGHYFLWNAGTAPVVPFMSVYAKSLGFSSSTVGVIYTILSVSGMLAKPIMGAIADRFRCQKIIFLTMQLVTAVAFLCILYVPPIEQEYKAHFSCDFGETVIDTCIPNIPKLQRKVIDNKLSNFQNTTAYCKLNCPVQDEQIWKTISNYWESPEYGSVHPNDLKFTAHVPLYLADTLNLDCVFFKVSNVTMENGKTHYPNCTSKESKISVICDIKCDSYKANDVLPKIEIDDENVVDYYQFWLFFGFMLIAWIGQAVVVSVSDAICFGMLGGEPNKYGAQRSFGSLGWGIFGIISGFILDASTEGETKNYTAVFYLAFGIILLDFFVSFQLKHAQNNLSASIIKDVGRLVTDVRILVFMGWCICTGICTGLVWNFLFWLIEDLAGDEITWIKTLEGIAMAIQCLGGELPLFFLSGWILKRIGHVNAMSFILLILGIRFTLYSIISDPWWILPIELLNGVTFGLMYSCMASYASIIAPPGTETTVQGLVGAVFEGVGVSLGSFVGGRCVAAYGTSATFRNFGIAAFIACLIHAGVQFILSKRTKDTIAYVQPQDAFSMLDDDHQELKLVA